MCGIAGFIDSSGHSSVEILSEMLNTLHHRGPDGSGLFGQPFLNTTVGLGHMRLSIIDLHESANQPLHYKSYTIIFNGEIYNYQEIKKELIILGHTFHTNSDTEVILHAYEEWGKNCVHQFIGMFVIVLYDAANGQIWICRDRAGVKPFYYYWKNGLFLFASELKAFHKHPRFEKEIESNAVALYMKYSYIPAPHTIFKNTHKLLPGHFLHFHIADSTFQIEKYWDVNDAYRQPKISISENEAIAETEKVLKKAFDYRMVADVPVGIFLSGGYDSSAVAAIIQKDRTEQLKTFTIGFHEEKYNEAPFAKDIAAHLGTNHSEYYCTIAEAKKILPTLPYYYDEPFGDSSAIPTILVSQQARKHVTVSLSADGGDEIFGGYNRHPIIQNMDRTFGRLPSFTRGVAYHFSGYVNPEKIPVLKHKKLIGQRYSKFRNLIREANATSYLKSMCSVLDDRSLSQLFQSDIEHLETYFEEEFSGNQSNLLDQILAKDYKTYMADDILTKVDRATMSVALEGREPFLDQHIIEWVAKLPNDMKIKNGNKKWLLKQIVHQYLPKEMMDRPKSGFGVPIEDWFQEELREYFHLYFSEEYISRQGIFRFDIIEHWVKRYSSGKREYITQLWNLLMFQMWYEKWMK